MLLTSVVIFTASLVLFGAYTFSSLRTDGWRKWAGPLGFIVVNAANFYAVSQTLGGCIPEWMMFGNDRLAVYSILYEEPVAIHLWGVQHDRIICVSVPWTNDTAGKMRAAESEQGGEMNGDLDYIPGYAPEDGEPPLHPKPVSGQEVKPEGFE